MSVISSQAEATDKPELAVTRQGAQNVMLVGKGRDSPTMLTELLQTNDTSPSTYPYKYALYMSRCKLAVNLA